VTRSTAAGFRWQAPVHAQLVSAGTNRHAGGGRAMSFRAGSFGFNASTLEALATNGAPLDRRYNATTFGPESGVTPGRRLLDVERVHDITEVPKTAYDTRLGTLRHVQLGACSSSDIESLPWLALEKSLHSLLIQPHSFELLTPDKARADTVVTRRFRRLVALLDRHRDSFRVRGFADSERPLPAAAEPSLRGSVSASGSPCGEPVDPMASGYAPQSLVVAEPIGHVCGRPLSPFTCPLGPPASGSVRLSFGEEALFTSAVGLPPLWAIKGGRLNVARGTMTSSSSA